ncbi:hypothetical protein FRB90_005373 [Tulasnella sp. 427]|nr:hypothetical protein FRB90_005373 [Tulasnella sp. 427]
MPLPDISILANFTNITSQNGFYYQSFALGIATALLTFILIITSLLIDRFRRGAITSLVMFELAWVGLLWVLWLATAAAVTDLGIFTTCGFVNARVESTCHQYQAVEAFSFLNWLILFGWWVTLLAMSIRAASNGISGVWKLPVTEHPGWSKNATSPYGQPSTTTYPTMPQSTAPGYENQPNYNNPPQQPQQHYGSPAPGQQQYGSPAPQQGYPTPQPQQGYAQPQPTYGQPAPGSPYSAPHQMPGQQPGYAGLPAQHYPNYPQVAEV